ncbi:methyltransferase domain-containing protein [Legionella waltersii]|nr:methyltransferase domain-containing protein [Legionella waltersii]
MAHKKQLILELGDIASAKILDYGCGAGDFIELFLSESRQPKEIYAVDSSKEMIEKIQIRFANYIEKGIVIPRVCSNPTELYDTQFDRIICHNVLECVKDKPEFINSFNRLLIPQGIFLLSHHDFDSAIYNSNYKKLTRELIHHFADTQQSWQKHCDGQMGRKIPGLVEASLFKDNANFKTWRIVEREFQTGNYGFIMANMITEVAKTTFDDQTLKTWGTDLTLKNQIGEYYFAIDLVLAVLVKEANLMISQVERME